jgi:hypothetical protein
MNWNKIGKRKTLGEFPKVSSENIRMPEVAPSDPQVAARLAELEDLVKKQSVKKSGDQRVTGRNKRIGFSCSPKFAKELRDWARKEDCHQIEILEKAFEEYKRKRRKAPEVA